jgi:hypothetical protein
MKNLEVEDDLAKGGTIMTDSLQRKMETVRSKINDTDIQMQNITARLLELIQESDPQRGEEKDILVLRGTILVSTWNGSMCDRKEKVCLFCLRPHLIFYSAIASVSAPPARLSRHGLILLAIAC